MPEAWKVVALGQRSRLEALIEAHVLDGPPQPFEYEYLPLGTVDRAVWQRGIKRQPTTEQMVESLHDFKEELTFMPAPV